MVFNTPLPRTGLGKRPLSSMKSDGAGWENAPTMLPPSRTSVNLPYDHYALIYVDNMGKLRVAESPSIQNHHATIFTSEVRDSFLEILGAKIGYQKPTLQSINPAALSYDRFEDASCHRQGKRRRLHTQNPVPVIQNPRPDFSASPSGAGANRIPIEIGDIDRLIQYYTISFRHFQQVNCRVVSKAWIKAIEPRKQVKHPYNGGRPKPGAPPGSKGDPEKTKPEWWPAGVVHREPDHLKKEERVELLVHIVRKVQRHDINADKLLDIAFDCRRQLKEQEKFAIIEEIFKVRRLEERYERGEVDASTIVYVMDREAHPKGDKDADSVAEPEPKIEPEERTGLEEVAITPTPSVEEVHAPFTLDPVDMPVPRHMPMGGEGDQLFPLPESLSFGEPTGQDRSFYAQSGEYHGDYSNALVETPTTPGMATPTEQHSSFDFLTQAPFPDASTVEHRPAAMPMQHSVSQFDTWTTPSFRQDLFSPLGYGSATSHAIPQSHVHYHMGMGSNVEDDGLPDLSHDQVPTTYMEPPSSRGSLFRTGSLSHPHFAH
ncbi:hypothetical protein BO94DRAFT_544820 [Aspergillus sclerotioniger CBS 115572]|uniref:Subtelomeric hrmA-associated cluster protein AFUB-079030/YDR124W-like helical bundle domain-containing protein n=1 Tax=Aspergillus sclerotioniger CBS 115572 TaxID=1450535 RepID=A0A317X4F6_9EURO|nr:hypothetical protein BO94DRAFT_544820 [Aspergillus sclerotioniger CBS 115572]PWY91440.1 hypothetical protein BO94DRAFT_544820 [Aspergillus sclerotioniger CBS 115572]